MTAKWKALITAALVAAIIAVAAAFGLVCKPAGDASTDGAVALRVSMRQAWSSHAWYTREYYAATILGTANAAAGADRLIKNQDDIGLLFGKYYGPDAAQQTAALLKEHIIIAVDIVNAAKAGDQEKLAEAQARWHKNFADLATFLNKANPEHFKYEETYRLLNDHLGLLTVAVTSFLTGDYVKSTLDNDAYYAEILMMADHFTTGIVRQFPARFQ